MIANLPDLVVLKIASFLQLPDLLNLLKYDYRIERKISNFKKKFYLCNHQEKENHIFTFSLPFLRNNYEELKMSLEYIRNNYFIDYTFQDDTYENYVCYIDSRNWFILEYYLHWFSNRVNYEFPDFYEMEFFDENKNYYGTISNNKPKLKNAEIPIEKKIHNFIYPNKEYKNINYINDFENLKRLLI